MSERDDSKYREPLVVRDRRRIDPKTGAVRPPSEAGDQGAAETPSSGAGQGRHAAGPQPAPTDAPPAPAPAPPETIDVPDDVQRELDERTADLQRLSAEYANYRRRVDRDREAVALNAKAQLLGDLLAILDDLERAAAHGDLTGPFKAVGDKLVAAVQKAGVEPFGLVGEPFDPSVHEAVQHDTSPEVDGPTVTAVLRLGYRMGERALRPAMVAVTDHEPAAAESGASDSETPGDSGL